MVERSRWGERKEEPRTLWKFLGQSHKNMGITKQEKRRKGQCAEKCENLKKAGGLGKKNEGASSTRQNVERNFLHRRNEKGTETNRPPTLKDEGNKTNGGGFLVGGKEVRVTYAKEGGG